MQEKEKIKYKKQKLFETESPLITQADKRKWTLAFVKWANEKYSKEGGRTSIFCCGYMNICDSCKHKKNIACQDCVDTIKQWYKNNGIEIPYNNINNFEEVLDIVENKDSIARKRILEKYKKWWSD